jgi:hypothetical protein
MRAGDAKVSEQQGRGLRLHRTTAIGMQRELARRHVMFRDRIIEQWPEQGGAFGIRHTPANNPAAEDVEDHIKVEVGPLRWAHQFGDIPGPDVIGLFRQKFRLLINRMAPAFASPSQG